MSTDAKFETVFSNLAKKLLLRRQDNIVGHKRLVFAIDKANKSLEATRKVIIQFFKDYLGFKENEIIFIDRAHFSNEGPVYTKFTDETKKEMASLGLSIFTET